MPLAICGTDLRPGLKAYWRCKGERSTISELTFLFFLDATRIFTALGLNRDFGGGCEDDRA
jgi:hypothetical protein